MARLSTCVVIPSYNHREFLPEALESVLGQTVRVDEIVVVDDGSSDGSRELLAAYEGRGVRVLLPDHAGAHAALNLGIEASRADIVFILNSDDVYAADRVATLRDLLVADQRLGLAGSWLEVIDERGRGLGIKRGWENMEPWEMEPPERTFQGTADPSGNLLQANYLASTSNFAFRRATWERAGPFRNLRFAHDWDFALRAATSAPMAVVPRPLLRYRVHANNTIRQDRMTMEFEVLWVMAANLTRFLGPGYVWAATPEVAAEHRARVYRSVQAFGYHRLLWLLAALAAADPAAFAALLEVDDPTRAMVLAEIR
jgi:glycosyltransferase involved in cell wall biosynthesis